MLEPDSREPWFICEAHKGIDLDMLKEKALRAMGKALENIQNKIEIEVLIRTSSHAHSSQHALLLGEGCR